MTLRLATPDDAAFLYELYASTRDDLAGIGLPEAQSAALIRLQYDVRARAYAAQFPDAADEIVVVDGQSAGRLLLASAEDGALVVVDVALLPAFRGRGVGGCVMRRVCARADERGVEARLHVARENPARRLYARSGFVEAGGDDVYLEMRRPALGTGSV